MIRIGTSGYGCDDWVGPFYPGDLNESDRLVCYAGEFDTTELNFSYYRQPTPWILERIAAKVPDGFVFSIKAFRGLTHEREDNAVDEPRLKGLLPPIAEATAPVAYVRFHGRNAGRWWRHDELWERYDYTYSKEELEEWVPKIRTLEERTGPTFVFANNHWQGQAVDTARQVRMLLA